jgi:hypothetical protein
MMTHLVAAAALADPVPNPRAYPRGDGTTSTPLFPDGHGLTW